MSTDPPVPDADRLRHWITDVEVSPDNADPNCKLSAKIFIDNDLVCSLPWIDYTRPLRWSGLLLCDISPSSKIALRLSRSVKGKSRYFNFPAVVVSEADEETGELIQELPEAVWVFTIKSLTPAVAERLFSDKIDNLGGIEVSYRPGWDLSMKYLFKSATHFAKFVTEARPESTAKVSFLIFMKTWELLDQQSEFDDTVQAILRALTGIRDIVDIMSQASSSMLATAINQSKEPIRDILALLEDVSVYIFNRYTTNDLANIPPDKVELNETSYIEAFLARLEDLQKEFYASWSAAAALCTDSVDVVDDEPSDTPLQHFQTTVDESTKMADLHEILDFLKPMDPSGYDPDQACLGGTREAILTRIVTWTQNRENFESFMWISGQPGTGKTSLATSLCQRLDTIQALAGSFFCRDNSNLNNPLMLINNLVCEIAMSCPVYAHEVAEAIRTSPKLCNAHLSLRFEGLVKRPLERLKSLTMPITLVIIVDGLDECGDCDSREKVLRMLYEMSRLVPWLKLIVTGRPIGDIQEYFHNNCPSGTVVQMQAYDASPDIRAYIEGQLGRLARTERWPDDSIDKLSNMAQGVFLWATLATKYIKKSPLPAFSRLQKVLDRRRSPVTDYFDKLYTRALEAILDDNDEETKDAYLRCIGLILATSERGPINMSELQGLLSLAGGMDQHTSDKIVQNLAPLLFVKEGRHANLHHSYFRDYIANSSRSGEFFIRPDRYEAEPADLCLKIMQRDLRFNVCGLETSHLRNSEVPDLKLRIQSHIGPALQYACTHWVNHFAASPNQALLALIKELFEGPQLMYWIEALSLLNRLDLAIAGLAKLASLELMQFAGWGLLASWAKDAHRFLLSFHDAIAISTPHLYLSALAFAPSESRTAVRMRHFFPNTIKVAQGDKNWHSCVKSILHPHAVQSLSSSPDGLRLIAGYSDGSLCMWDDQTGARTSELLVGHSDSVMCVVFSPDGNLVASSSWDTTIRVWNVSNCLKSSHTLLGHSASVNSVAFSPDATIFASGSSDKTIRLWHSKTLCSIGEPYIAHSSRVSSLAFSPDGTKLASGSWDKTIRVWSVDLDNLKLTGNPLQITGHSDSVTCVAFSPDGLKIASGSVDRTIRMWDAQTGSKIQCHNSSMKHSDSIVAIAFSSNGNIIASSSLDGAVQLWNASTFAALCCPFGHFKPVNSIAFSPDNAYIVSGSTDMTTRVWEINALTTTMLSKSMATGPIVGHSSTIRSIVLSIDGTRIISGSSDKTVCMWDAQTGSQIGQPFIGHSDNVLCVAVSPDGICIASGSGDKTMKIWDITTYTTIHSHQHDAVIRCVAFSPNSDLIAFGSDDSKIYLWEPTEWRRVGDALQGHSNGYVLSIAFSPDGTCLASSAGDRMVILWDVKTRNRLGGLLSGHTAGVNSVDFSPCGTRLVSGSDDSTVRLWDIKSGSTIRVLSGHSTFVTTVAFSPDGSYIASGSWDNTVRLWNTETGQIIGQPFSEHSGHVWSAIFSHDGKYVLSGSADKTIRLRGLDASRPVSEHRDTNDSPGSFHWPANPYQLSCHPHSGWATDDQQSLVFWLPPHYEQPDQFLSTSAQVSHPQPCFDYSNFVHGTAWTGVARDDVRRNLS